MWLIRTRDYELQFVSDVGGFIRYAILSHTWGTDEVTFQDMADIEAASKKAGWAKIKKTCDIARDKYNLMYAWVDTCCIDKRSSAELSEAINTMFAWYKAAHVCLVHLSDYWKVKVVKEDFETCRWFGRGWTLQELIAPRDAVFYNDVWDVIGTKKALAGILAEITRVDKEVLENADLLSTIPVGKKMSWAAGRRTTRIEDVAYGLLGIFFVNMPLLYGEGGKAFIRLQQELARVRNDLTLFAWRDHSLIHPNRGLFAKSPDEFRDCAKLKVPVGIMPAETEFAMTNRGVRFDRNLVLRSELHEVGGDEQPTERIRFDAVLGLDCLEKSERTDDEPRWVGIYLSSAGGNYFRSDANKLAYFPSRSHWRADALAGKEMRVAYIEPTLSEQEVLTIYDTPVMVIYDQPLMGILDPRPSPDLKFPTTSIKPWERTDGTVLLRKSLRTPLKLHFFRVLLPGSPENTFRFVLVVGVPMPALWLSPWRAIYYEGDLRELDYHEISDSRIFLESAGEEDDENEGLMTDEEKEILFHDYIFQQSSDDTGRVRQDLLPEHATVRVKKRNEGGFDDDDGFLHVSILNPPDKYAVDMIQANQLIILTCERDEPVEAKEEVPEESERVKLGGTGADGGVGLKQREPQAGLISIAPALTDQNLGTETTKHDVVEAPTGKAATVISPDRNTGKEISSRGEQEVGLGREAASQPISGESANPDKGPEKGKIASGKRTDATKNQSPRVGILTVEPKTAQ